jgi:uncharacterized protein
MTRMIFINLPVAELARATRFYEALGFTRQPAFSDESAACMVWSEAIHVMLLEHARWRTFTDRPIPPPTSSEVQLGLSCYARAAVDAMLAAAAANAGTPDVNPVQDHGFMYARDFLDPDGHCWSALWMDPAAVPPQE